jgi:hypothetical protein
VKSLQLRLISRTPLASRRTRRLKPSCLISCQPAGAARRGFGRRGQAGLDEIDRAAGAL